MITTLFRLLEIASCGIGRRLRKVLSTEGLTLRDFLLLEVLLEKDGINQESAAVAIGINRNAVVGLVDHLEQLGYIQRKVNPLNRRERLLSLTAEGRRALERASESVGAVVNDACCQLGADDRSELQRLLEAVIV